MLVWPELCFNKMLLLSQSLSLSLHAQVSASVTSTLLYLTQLRLFSRAAGTLFSSKSWSPPAPIFPPCFCAIFLFWYHTSCDPLCWATGLHTSPSHQSSCMFDSASFCPCAHGITHLSLTRHTPTLIYGAMTGQAWASLNRAVVDAHGITHMHT